MRTELGKIKNISFGFGGYQGAQFGVSVTLGGSGWGVGDFRGPWANRTEGARWTEEDQHKDFAQTCIWLRDILTAAKKETVDQLKGVPVEVTFDGMMLRSWRILEEVI